MIRNGHKAALVVLIAGLMAGCATNPPAPQMVGITAAPENHYHFGYNVEGLNYGLKDVQTFDNSASTFFILPAGVTATRAYTQGEISKQFRKDGVYSVVDAVADTWLFAASNGEAYCVTRSGDPSKVCSQLLHPSHADDESSASPVATPLPASAKITSTPAHKKPEPATHRTRVVGEDKVIEGESIAQIRARLENLQKQLQSIIEQLKKEGNDNA